MTPAVDAVKKADIAYTLHEYDYDPATKDDYGEDAAKGIGVSTKQMFKTLVVELNNNVTTLGVAVIPVFYQLDFKAYAIAIQAKKVRIANKNDAEWATGFRVGGVSPIGQKKKLPIIVDSSVNDFDTVYVSAGKRGAYIELSPQDLIKVTDARIASIGK